MDQFLDIWYDTFTKYIKLISAALNYFHIKRTSFRKFLRNFVNDDLNNILEAGLYLREESQSVYNSDW